MSSGPDASLDEYCERLNAALEELRKGGEGPGTQESPAPASALGSESLESYLDRLTDAFDKLARARNERAEQVQETSRESRTIVVETASSDASFEAALPGDAVPAGDIIDAPEPLAPTIEAVEPLPSSSPVMEEAAPEAPIVVLLDDRTGRDHRPRRRPRTVARKKAVRAAKPAARSRKKAAAAPKARTRSLSRSRKRRGGK